MDRVENHLYYRNRNRSVFYTVYLGNLLGRLQQFVEIYEEMIFSIDEIRNHTDCIDIRIVSVHVQTIGTEGVKLRFHLRSDVLRELRLRNREGPELYYRDQLAQDLLLVLGFELRFVEVELVFD